MQDTTYYISFKDWFLKVKTRQLLLVLSISATTLTAFAGAENSQYGYRPGTPGRATMPAPRAIERSPIKPIYRPGDEVGRNLPLPAPLHAYGKGKELNDYYGPTYYYPSQHNNYQGLGPYYPFIQPDQKAANYKVPGVYCPGQNCGPSRSSGYWDHYDDWKRGGRYEQHQ